MMQPEAVHGEHSVCGLATRYKLIWESRNLQCNLEKLQRAEPDHQEELEELACRPGPLNFLLARFSHDAEGHMTGVLAALLNLRLQISGEHAIASAHSILHAIAEWDLGFHLLYIGWREYERGGRSAQVDVEKLVYENPCAALALLWRAGAVRYCGHRDEDGFQQALRAHDLAYSLRYTLAEHGLHGGFCDAGCLAVNGLLLAEHYDRMGNVERDVFDVFLRNSVQPSWPYDCRANRSFLQQSGLGPAHYRRLAGIACDRDDLGWRAEVLTDQFEILNLGNAFDSCLRIGGQEPHILGWAANANILVAAVRDADGRILGRRTLGLLTDPLRVCVSQSYPLKNPHIARHTELLAEEIMDAVGVTELPATGEIPETIYASSYVDDFV